MKKNTVKKLNTVFVSGIAILLILTVFFCSFAPAVDVFASEFFPQDCPDCTDGTCTIQSVVDCTATGCVDGSVTTQLTNTCETCSGASVLYSSSSVNCTVCSGLGGTVCSKCSGNGYILIDATEDGDSKSYYDCYGCAACGGSGGAYLVSGVGNINVTTAQNNAISLFTSYTISNPSYYYFGSGLTSTCSTCVGSGTTTIVTSSDCPDCTDGNIYSTVTTDCTTCLGTGEVVGNTTINCPTCDGTGIIYAGISNISNISTVLTTENTDITVTFSFDETGDLGDLEYIWYINNNVYVQTETPSLTLSEIPIGIYGMYCEIVSPIGYSTTTNQFELWVNPAVERNYIYITAQPSSYTIKQGQAVSISLDEENATDVIWYLDDEVSLVDVLDYDLAVLDIGVYEIYCEYTLDGETITSDIATISVVNDEGLTEELESAWDNLTTGFWVAIGGFIAAAVVAILVAIFSKKE